MNEWALGRSAHMSGTLDEPSLSTSQEISKKVEMGEEKPEDPMYIVSDLLEDILLTLPLKPLLRFKTVSKQWRSVLESKTFAERRKKGFEKKWRILAAGESEFEGDEEMEVVYLQPHDATTRPSLSCDGLVCIPLPDCLHLLNPSTGEFLRFPFSGPSHGVSTNYEEPWWDIFPGNWAMGFGRDQVTGSYKVVRMSFDSNQFEILDVSVGVWRKLIRPPPYQVESTRKSACVNGSIYWLNLFLEARLLAFDLHTQEFRDVPALPPPTYSGACKIVNLEDRLAIADVRLRHRLKIWTMDPLEQCWTLTYCISLPPRVMSASYFERWFRPLAVSKQGSLYFYDSEKRLFKYYPETDFLCCISPHISVLAPFLEDLAPLPGGCVAKIGTSGYQYGLTYLRPGTSAGASSIVERIGSLIPSILVTSALVSLIILGYRCKCCT